jgi:hypothetical protein
MFSRIRNAKVEGSTPFTGTNENNGLVQQGVSPLCFVFGDVTTDVSASGAPCLL